MRTVTDLHPEVLLDRDARGELTPPERTRLDAHLARCAACRFEQQLRCDFADDLLGDVTPSSVELALAGSSGAGSSGAGSSGAGSSGAGSIGAGVSKSLAVPVAAPSETPAPLVSAAPKKALPPPRRRVSRATWLLVAAAVFGVSAAGATSAGQRALSRILGEPSAFVPSAAPAAEHVAAKHVSRHRAAPAPTATTAATDLPCDPPSTIDVLVRSPAPEPASGVPAVHHRATADGAPSLFEAATDARRRGDYARALVLQRELVSRYPQSRESHVSRATAGRLLLDRGDPRGALASFDAYLAGGSGELGEEAMIGRATALERLGRTPEAIGAWQALLAAYPETAYAAHARSRLGSMSAR